VQKNRFSTINKKVTQERNRKNKADLREQKDFKGKNLKNCKMIFNHIKNRIQFAYECWKGKAKVKNKPIQIVIGITNACNANCQMCSRRLMKRKVGFMEFKTLKRIIEQTKEYAEFIEFSFDGEALLHPQVFDFIKYCKENNLLVGTSTNGISLTPKICEKLLESDLDCLVLSLDAATSETYKLVKGVDKFGEAMRNIKHLIELKEEKNSSLYIVAQFVQSRLNYKEKEEFIELWKSYGIPTRIKPCLTFGGLDFLNNKITRKQSCYLAWRSIHIYWDGMVVLCCLDLLNETPLGNINEKSLEEIWNSERIQKFRRLLAEERASEIKICENCNYPSINPILLFGSVFVNDLTRFKILVKAEKILRYTKF
jgi:radical SAM protein with 4Fe4S-binding SPASM domain